MLIYVKSIGGNQMELDVDETDKFLTVKQKIEQREGIPPDQQKLIFNGRPIADDEVAKAVGLEGGNVLHLVLSLRGG
ncbi:Ubiquitin [Carpediemonas membranifera]|uniref:Ubiquitin n=1 Tax=Carpediemonas membranifera TaxID=201153 RepID=A0A8J6B5N3_9EUKA|nr:Ubiquitin [Carpediemonas membranifera]|eukprot:KAG9394789.1 Ubiquitin [Carpediemonas membranifera]